MLEEREFTFGAFKNNEPQPFENFTIVVPAGATSGQLVITNESQYNTIISTLENENVSIYELDGSGIPVVNNGNFKLDGIQYRVSYSTSAGSGNTIISAASEENYTNYIGKLSVSNSDSVTVIQKYFLGYVDATTYFENLQCEWTEDNDQRSLSISTGNGDKVIIQDYKSIEDNIENFELIKSLDGITDSVSNKLEALKKFSVELANAKNGEKAGRGSVSVINLNSTTGILLEDLNAANFYETQNGKGIINTVNEGGYILFNINIDDTKFKEYQMSQIVIDGYNANDPDEREELARHLIFNFVTKNGATYQPYGGKINLNSRV